jgi:hypothetical protein
MEQIILEQIQRLPCHLTPIFLRGKLTAPTTARYALLEKRQAFLSLP